MIEYLECQHPLALTPNYVRDIDLDRTQSQELTEDLGNEISLDLVYIPGGMATIGSDECQDEQPIHRVKIRPFAIGKYPIVQAQYQAVMGYNPAQFLGDNRPVEGVNWFDTMAFCQKLSQQTGHTYTLPSEAQWEYAARSGTTSKYHCGNSISTDLANYNGEKVVEIYDNIVPGIYRKETTKVGIFPPNAFGLYDIHGNVWEWCLDEWHSNYHDAPISDSAWLDCAHLDENIARVKRGGSWNYYACSCRSSFRCSNLASNCANTIGFRVVRIID
jgi:eukaryotic-like serine/threonine-protein kinase